jgi:ABC-type xylose transport system permease subunit
MKACHILKNYSVPWIWLVGWLVGWFVGRLIGWLVGYLVSYLASYKQLKHMAAPLYFYLFPTYLTHEEYTISVVTR